MSRLKIQDTIHGFTVLREAHLKELDAVLYEMEHDQTGLKLVWIDRKEDNKTFAIAFETLPWDDTGVFHILEHSVLCGSDKYPVKEPFVELVKNSMNTFLNALTFPDKTMYPISSRNDKDFINLMRVYLDAVLHPAIYHNPEIFKQEGWHYEFDENGKPSYTGVVFNEMKGAFASSGRIMGAAMDKAMLPDTPYAFESGGDPAKIPDLRYEKFIESHQKFYSPSNAYIYLDGDIDICKVLGIIHDEYLKDFERRDRVAPPAFQQPVNGGSRVVPYELGPNEPEEGRTRIAWGNMIGRFDDREKLSAVSILNEVIAGNNMAPLPRAILEKGLAEDVIVSVADSIAQPYAKIEVRNYRKENTDLIRTIIHDELVNLSNNGLDHSQIESAIANAEFLAREKDYGSYPQGLIYGFAVFETWLYGGLPEQNLEVGSLFADLRHKMNEGYFEQLLKEIYLENEHTCEIILTPSKTLGEERRKAEAMRLEAEQENWSDEDIRRLMSEEIKLKEWQNKEDTAEDLSCLPHLTIEDIQDMPEKFPLEVCEIDGVTVLKHDIITNGIIYAKAYFDIDGLDKEQLAVLSFATDLLGQVSTKQHDAETLMNLERLYCGGMSYYVDSFAEVNHPDNCKIKLGVSLSTLPENLEKAVGLVTEILCDTPFCDEQDVQDILKQERMARMQSATMGGHSVAISRLEAMTSIAGVVDEWTGGLDYYKWLKKQEENWNWDELKAKMERLLKDAVNTNRMTVSITGGSDRDAETLVSLLKAKLDNSVRPFNGGIKSVLEPYGVRKEGILIPADIAFAARGGRIQWHGGNWTGEMSLAGRLVTYTYLWNTIRVQGGAYGTGLLARTTGLTGAYSYRDPNGKQSLEAYTNVGRFLREFLGTDPDITGFIIGCVSDSSRLMTPRTKGAASDNQYFSNITHESRCKNRKLILGATPEKLLKLADAIEASINNGGICIVAGKNQMNEIEGLDELYTI